MSEEELHELVEAMANADLETIKRLLSPYPTRPRGLSWTPVHDAIEHGNAAVVALTLNLGGDISARSVPDGFAPLHFVVDRIADGEHQTGQRDDDAWEILRVLLKAGADIHTLDLEGTTAIDMAMRYHRPDIAEVLLAGGISI